MNQIELAPSALSPSPAITPPLDPAFCPAALANRVFRAAARATGGAASVRLALEQADGSVSHHATEIFPADAPQAGSNFFHVERLVKFLLWARGGFRLHFDGPRSVGEALQRHFRDTATGRFDADTMGGRLYEQPFEVVIASALPPARARTAPLGRHLDGCRIGFDLGASDRKVAAVHDGRVVFSEEVVWHPVPQTDPQ